jgi:Domain of unknown function (DUF6429)
MDGQAIGSVWDGIRDLSHLWDALNRLYERGLIGDPVNKAKSVVLTDEGLRESERLFNQYFVVSPERQLVGS